MKIFLVLLLFGTLQASQIPCRGEYEPLSERILLPQPQSLSEAVRWGNLDQVQAFLWQKISPNIWDEEGRTPMHYAMLRSDKQAIPILRVLLAAQGDILVKDHYGATVVDDALTLGNEEALNIFILNCGLNLADGNLREKYPVTNKLLAGFVFVRSPIMVPIWSVPVPSQRIIMRRVPFHPPY